MDVHQKVWGSEEWLVNTELYCAKRLRVTPGFQCSLHRHRIKDETFVVIEGSGWIKVKDVIHPVTAGATLRVMPLTWHTFWSKTGMTILEVSTHHDDNDVERASPSGPLSR